MKRLLVATTISAGLLFSVDGARACGIHPAPLAIIHSALPTPLPAGAVIAEVEVGPEQTDWMLPYGLRVRVRRMIQGDAASILVLRTGRLNSCLDAFGNGRTGFIVAVPTSHHEGVPVVTPLYAHRNEGYRLPDGFQLPPLESRGFSIGN